MSYGAGRRDGDKEMVVVVDNSAVVGSPNNFFLRECGTSGFPGYA